MGDGRDRTQARMAIVVAGGDLPARADLDRAWPGWADGTDLVIAADAGLTGATALGLRCSVIVGDLDSADPAAVAAARAAGVLLARSSPDKDESDTELAVLEAVARGATRLTILGALGGPRLDHALANVWLLAHAALVERSVELLDGDVRVSLVSAPDAVGHQGRRRLPGRLGATVTLLPFGAEADGVTTHGLRFPLDDESLVPGPARGLSNVRTGADAAITLRRGRLLVIESAWPPDGLSSTP